MLAIITGKWVFVLLLYFDLVSYHSRWEIFFFVWCV